MCSSVHDVAGRVCSGAMQPLLRTCCLTKRGAPAAVLRTIACSAAVEEPAWAAAALRRPVKRRAGGAGVPASCCSALQLHDAVGCGSESSSGARSKAMHASKTC